VAVEDLLGDRRCLRSSPESGGWFGRSATRYTSRVPNGRLLPEGADSPLGCWSMATRKRVATHLWVSLYSGTQIWVTR